MRALVLLLGLAIVRVSPTLAQSGALAGQPPDSATRAQLLAAREAVWRSWFAGDTTRVAQLLPSALAAGSPGGWETREATLANAKQFATSGGRLLAITFDSTSIRLRGHVAVLQARYHLVLERQGERRTQTGIATEVFVRENGRWLNPFWYLE